MRRTSGWSLGLLLCLLLVLLPAIVRLCQYYLRSYPTTDTENMLVAETSSNSRPKVLQQSSESRPRVHIKATTGPQNVEPGGTEVATKETTKASFAGERAPMNDQHRDEKLSHPCTAPLAETCSLVLAKGDTFARPHRHIMLGMCSTSNEYLAQILRLVASIVLTQATSYSKGNFNWDVWILLDRETFDKLGRRMASVQLSSAVNRKGAQIEVHLLLNNAVAARRGPVVTKIPFEPCFTYCLYAAELLPAWVEEVAIFGADELVVGDLERFWGNALYMGWSTSKMFAAVEERVRENVYTAVKCRKDRVRNPQCDDSLPKPTSKKKGSSKQQKHFFYSGRGIATGSLLLSVTNARKYDLAGWIEETLKVYDASSFGLGDQSLVNRYGMDHPDRMTLLQCNLNVRAIGRCDIQLHPPVVLHGTGQRFASKRPPWDRGTPLAKKSSFISREMKIWHQFALEFDRLFEILRTQGPERLPKVPSVWEAISITHRNALMGTIGAALKDDQPGAKVNAGAMTPRIDFPPLGSRKHGLDLQTWRSNYLDKFLNQQAKEDLLIKTCQDTCAKHLG